MFLFCTVKLVFLFLVSRVKSVSKAVRRFHIDGCAIAKFGARVEIWTALYDTFTDLTFTFPFQALHNIVYYLHFILQGLGAAIPTLCYVFHYFSPKAKKKNFGTHLHSCIRCDKFISEYKSENVYDKKSLALISKSTVLSNTFIIRRLIRKQKMR